MIRKMVMGVVLAAMLAGSSVAAVPVAPTPVTENFRYTWRLRGGLAWIASVRFPTSGEGHLTTVYHRTANPTVDTELKITAEETEGFYLYQSQIDDKSIKTLMTYHGYSWGEKSRHERTFFDYVKRLARIRKETSDDGVEHRVKAIPPREMKDVLTGIYYLRQKAMTLKAPVAMEIFSDGKLYPVMFRPEGFEEMTVAGKGVQTRTYRITAAPGAERKWPGGVRVWLTTDERHVPVRIEIHRSFATLRLDLIEF
jgi:hypothetical protein